MLQARMTIERNHASTPGESSEAAQGLSCDKPRSAGCKSIIETTDSTVRADVPVGHHTLRVVNRRITAPAEVCTAFAGTNRDQARLAHSLCRLFV